MIESLTFCSVDTVGVHYSATLWRWYRNWLGNKDAITAKYGQRWYRVSCTQWIRTRKYNASSHVNRSGSSSLLGPSSLPARVAPPASR